MFSYLLNFTNFRPDFWHERRGMGLLSSFHPPHTHVPVQSPHPANGGTLWLGSSYSASVHYYHHYVEAMGGLSLMSHCDYLSFSAEFCFVLTFAFVCFDFTFPLFISVCLSRFISKISAHWLNLLSQYIWSHEVFCYFHFPREVCLRAFWTTPILGYLPSMWGLTSLSS